MILRLTTVFLKGTTPAAGVVPRARAALDVAWPRGEDGTIVFSIVDEAGAPVNVAGGSFSLGLRSGPFAAAPAFVREGDALDALNGVVAFTITADDTAALNAGRYLYDVWYVDAEGARHQLVPASAFTLQTAATLAGEDAGAATISPFIRGAVDTVNGPGTSLAEIDGALLTDGIAVWVRDHDTYFVVKVGKGLDVDHDTVETVLNLAGGQWVLFSSGTGGGGTGPRGPQGIQGPPGRDGEDGEDGPPGPPGRDGRDGAAASAGSPGADGAPGRDGRDGPPGRDGEDGEDGLPGPPGRDGRNGADGSNGTNGTNGTNGAAGASGAPGRDGEDGEDAPWYPPAPRIDPLHLLPEPPGFDIRYRPMANIFNDIEFWKPGSSGGGSCPDGGPYAGPGVTGAICGDTTAAAFASVQWAINDRTIYFDTGVGIWRAETRIAVSAVPSSGQFGYLLSGIANLSTFYGCYFRIDAASANFQCVCKNASGTTTVATSVAVPTTSTGTDRTLYKTLRVVVSRDGDQARFFIGNALVATITTNIPDNTVAMQQYAFHLNNDADSIARKCWMTYVRLRLNPPAE